MTKVLKLMIVLTAIGFATPLLATDSAELLAFKKAIRAKYDIKEKAFAEHDPETILTKFYSEDVISVGEGEHIAGSILGLFEEACAHGAAIATPLPAHEGPLRREARVGDPCRCALADGNATSMPRRAAAQAGAEGLRSPNILRTTRPGNRVVPCDAGATPPRTRRTAS